MTVHLHTVLQRQTPEGPERRLTMTLPAESTLADLLKSLEIPADPDGILLVVNGRTANLACVLRDGDEVHLIPALSGGVPDPEVTGSLLSERQSPRKLPDVFPPP